MIYTLTLNPAVDRELLVDRISFDTVLRAGEFRVDCGGKGFNVSRMLKAMNVDSTALGFAAGKAGKFLRESLNDLGILTDFVWVDGETRTNVSIVSAEDGRYVKANEPGPVISPDNIESLLKKIKDLARPGDLWVLAGSLPPGVPASIYSETTLILKSTGARVIIDTSGESLAQSCNAAPYLVKPNDAEAFALTGMKVDTQDDLVKAGRAICALGPEHVVISMGKAGAMLVTEDTAFMAHSPEIVAQNPIGAGDSMVGGLVFGISQNLHISESLALGIACGASTASRKGTDIGSRDQVNTLLSRVKISKL
ncbi:MAG: 1-phosphofructokinase [Deltaproteobacteria bacterium]|nr:1-phosphofructokinase [Deltaproteobacteria bacterium]